MLKHTEILNNMSVKQKIALAANINCLADQEYAELGIPRVKFATLDELFAESDVVSLHCPLTPDTKELVNANRLKAMKPSAILINTGRGPLVNEQDLADALNEGRIAGAGLDVLSVEPSVATNPLLSAKNCFITPHIAWATKEARTRLMDIAINNLRAYQEGNIINNVAK